MAYDGSLCLENSKNPLPAPLLDSEEVDVDISDVVTIESVLYRNMGIWHYVGLYVTAAVFITACLCNISLLNIDLFQWTKYRSLSVLMAFVCDLLW